MAIIFFENWKNAERNLKIVKKYHPEAKIVQWGNHMILQYDGKEDDYR